MTHFILNSKNFVLVLISGNKHFFVCNYDQFGNPPYRFVWTKQDKRIWRKNPG